MYCRMGKVESEEHFLFECPNYEKNREQFRTKLIEHDEKFNSKGGFDLLNQVFESKDNAVFTLLGNLIDKSWKTRYLMASNYIFEFFFIVYCSYVYKVCCTNVL